MSGTKQKVLSAIVIGLTSLSVSYADRWENITAEMENTIPNNEIQFLQQDDAGIIWIGTMRGLVKYQDGAFEEVAGGRVWDLLPMGDGVYFIGSSSGIFRLQDGELTQEHDQPTSGLVPFGDSDVWACELRPEAELAVLKLLMRTDDGEWEVLPAFEDKRVSDLYNTSDGHVWVQTEGDGIYRIDPETYDKEDAEDAGTHHLSGMNLTTLMEDSSGRVWVGSWERGLRVFEDGRWRSYFRDADTFVFDIVEDANGNIWVATSDRGLWHHNGEEWVSLLAEEGAINMLYATSDGRVWISSRMRGGLHYWDGENWHVSLTSPLPIRCMLEINNGEIWAGGILDGLHIKRP